MDGHKRRARRLRRARPKKRPASRRRDSSAQELPARHEVNGEVPPNENIRKHPDEVYGDTEIPGRP